MKANEPRGRGRPRSEEAHQAILAGFMDEIRQHGYARASIDAVAKTTGVSRTTIYRRYKDKSEIALEAAASIAAGHDGTLSGNFERDLKSFLRQTFKTANDLGPLFTALMAEAQADKDFATQVWEKFSKVRRQQLQVILDQQQAGDHEVLMDMVFGAIWYRMMSGHGPLNSKFLNSLVSAVNSLT